ncbi:hypothetical protein [Cesiribacter sp. SM1]|uniref:hypothetical protein n=1 Tax=Cesiribacter sp. SM1 TaxID=2861196 RepID=UPI001CD51909|nr:hypothetical protein [Cesiribacter sp. SM1]
MAIQGAWQELEVNDIDMAVPLSQEELLRERKAIFQHQPQKDKALFRAADPREFWLRADDINKATAKWYDWLGLAEY